ncbi:MAG: hypothetical protein PHR25_02715 [Clostridia bacterium]|nr:hypothetical protein [Clostridia bacterium]MDD4375672.1 hypothetical protein [Clostridia bacterium]
MFFLIIILSFLLILTIAILNLQIRVNLHIDLRGKNVYDLIQVTKPKREITIVIKIFRIIPIYKFVLKDKKGKKEEEDSSVIEKKIKELILKDRESLRELLKNTNEIINRIKFEQLVFSFGFNTNDYVKNAYINGLLNSIVCMIINGNQEQFNLNKLYYQIHISEYNYYFINKSIISFIPANNIDILKYILKLIRFLKENKRNEVRSDKNVRTSNRKSNDDSNEFVK